MIRKFSLSALRDYFRNVRLANLYRALKLIWRTSPQFAVGNIVLLGIQVFFPLATLYLTQRIIDAITSALSAPDRLQAFQSTFVLVLALGGVNLGSMFCTAIAAWTGEAQANKLRLAIQDEVLSHSIAMDMAYYESAEYHNTLHRAQQNAASRPSQVIKDMLSLGQGFFSLVALLIWLVAYQPILCLLLLAMSGPLVLLRFWSSNQIYKLQIKCTPQERKVNYLHWLLTSAGIAKEIRLYELGRHFLDQYLSLSNNLHTERQQLAKRQLLLNTASEAGGVIVFLGAYALIAWHTVTGSITIGGFVMLYQAFQRGQGFLRNFLNGLASLYEDGLFLSHLFDFLDLKPHIRCPQKSLPMPRPLRQGIMLQGVSFHYPQSGRPALADISLTIRPGEHIALVGENGAGKTTLIKLLCRLYDPTHGKILLDGQDLRQFDPLAWRREMSVLCQDFVRYHCTVRDNILLGAITREVSDEELAAAARFSKADTVIGRLPHHYHTMLGQWLEKGENLSEGEWQKIALARTFLRSAPIVILDEPTSALDPLAEREVFQKIRQLAKGRTAVLISHRLSITRDVDCIYVLAQGRIAEYGTHAELIKRGDLYARMYNAQAENYR